MPSLAIISRDPQTYLNLLQTALPTSIELVFSGNYVGEPALQADILLAEPGYVANQLSKFKNLQWLQSTWAGNQLLLQHPKRNYRLTGIKDVFGQDMAEFVMAYLLYFARNLEGFFQAQPQRQWRQDLLGDGLQSKTLAVLGVGSIGRVVAERAKAFGMQTLGVTTHAGNCPYIDRYIGMTDLPQWAAEIDYLVSILPDTPDTQGIINQNLLAALPEHCVLINVGRGGVVVEQDLVNALQQGQIKAAVLDVFRQEPLPEQHAFWQTPNLHITHHTSAMSRPEHITPIFIDNLERFLAEQPLLFQMDFDRGY